MKLKEPNPNAGQANTLRLQALALLQAAEEIDGVFVSAKSIGIENNQDQPLGVPVAVLAVLKDEGIEVYANLPDKLVRVHTFDFDLYAETKDDPDMSDMVEALPADIAALAPEDYKLPVESDGDEVGQAPRG